MRDKLGRFIKGNKPLAPFKKGQPPTAGSFKKGHIPYHTKKAKEEARKRWLREKNPNWKDGKYKSKGYVYILQPNHPFCNNYGYVRRSRLVMEKHLGRYLKPEEQVHHRGIKYSLGSIENKQDDRIENLKLFISNSKHIKFHYPKGSKFGINKSGLWRGSQTIKEMN